jgi:enamine deaminase RidA (YjgF/YER057c/UK114 family)
MTGSAGATRRIQHTSTHEEHALAAIIRTGISRRLSRTVTYNGVVYLAGVTADDCNDDIVGQMTQVLTKIDRYLASAGTNKSQLLTAQIWLKDVARDFEGMNKVWDNWTAKNSAPTRATAQCEMAEADILVEILVTAAIVG